MNRKMVHPGAVLPPRSRSLLTRSNVYAIALVALWIIYILNRTFFGIDAISDENFFMNAEIEAQKKRKYFIYLAQAFGDFNTTQLMISIINVIAVIASYFIVSKINFNDSRATFFHLFYFTAVANYVFRDSLLLLIFVLLTAALFSRKKMYMLMASPLLLLLYDFRMHYLVFFFASIAPGYAFSRIKSNFSVIVLAVAAFGSAVSMAAVIGDSINIYNITLTEFAQSREERYSQTLSLTSFAVAFVTHYLAPIPTSLLQRILMGSETGLIEVSPYGVLDDAYRFVYKSFLYFIIIYLLIHWRTMVEVMNRWRFEAGFLIAFSLSNAMLYSGYTFGGNHERIKLFSTFFLVYLFAGALHLRKQRQSHRLSIKWRGRV